MMFRCAAALRCAVTLRRYAARYSLRHHTVPLRSVPVRGAVTLRHALRHKYTYQNSLELKLRFSEHKYMRSSGLLLLAIVISGHLLHVLPLPVCPRINPCVINVGPNATHNGAQAH